jgi:hypothetical protein
MYQNHNQLLSQTLTTIAQIAMPSASDGVKEEIVTLTMHIGWKDIVDQLAILAVLLTQVHLNLTLQLIQTTALMKIKDVPTGQTLVNVITTQSGCQFIAQNLVVDAFRNQNKPALMTLPIAHYGPKMVNVHRILVICWILADFLALTTVRLRQSHLIVWII